MSSFKRVVTLKRGVETEFPFAVFANDKAGLIVADLDNVRFGHASRLAGLVAGIL